MDSRINDICRYILVSSDACDRIRQAAFDIVTDGITLDVNKVKLGNLAISPDALAAVKQMLGEGRKISAIKYVRQITNSGLREAKDAVETLPDYKPIQPY